MPPSSLLSRPASDQEATGRVDHLGRHVLGLAVVLLALLPILGREGLFSADEGAALAQTRLLNEERGWLLDHPLPEIDPENQAFPLENSTLVDRAEGVPAGAPFSKHPAYVIALAPFDRAGGTKGVLLTSVLGTVLAAAIAGLLARRLVPGWAGLAVWATGLATPLFFDSWIVIAHTLGAGLAGCATLAVVRAHERRGSAPILTTGAAMVAAVLLRNEAVLFGAALAAAACFVGWRSRQRATVLAGLAAFAGAAAGHVVDGMLSASVTGADEGVATAGLQQAGFLAGRVSGAAVTLFRPSYGVLGVRDLLVLVAVLCLVGAVLIARRRPEDKDGVQVFAVLAVLAAVGRAILGPQIVPGLLVAAPALTAGLATLRRRSFEQDVPQLLGLTSALFVGAVLATQYAVGGSGEWGGRYFALALPLLVPLALAGLHDLADGLEARTRRTLLGAFAVVALALTLVGGRALVAVKDGTTDVVARIEATGDGLDEPVVLATNGTPGRVAWRHVLAGEDWLTVEPDTVATWLDRLEAEGRDVVLVTQDLAEVRPATVGWTDADDEEPVRFLGWWVVGLRHP